jgi:hypothetical protein
MSIILSDMNPAHTHIYPVLLRSINIIFHSTPVWKMTSSFRVCLPKRFVRYSPLSLSLSLMRVTCPYLTLLDSITLSIKNTNYEAPHYEIIGICMLKS